MTQPTIVRAAPVLAHVSAVYDREGGVSLSVDQRPAQRLSGPHAETALGLALIALGLPDRHSVWVRKPGSGDDVVAACYLTSKAERYIQTNGKAAAAKLLKEAIDAA